MDLTRLDRVQHVKREHLPSLRLLPTLLPCGLVALMLQSWEFTRARVRVYCVPQ